ncbi:MAG: 4Fe-4S binding protein [candidate division WOR-3 bacterium]|nr:4Fe-4S binding protein [candidate division WOR-3 bacterium]
MPRGDGTGPMGKGPGTGRGLGRGRGRFFQEPVNRVFPPQRQITTKQQKAIVDKEKCTGCGICVNQCPINAISINGTAKIDKTKCTGCGICVAACPVKAIRLG